jgi:tyrosyl-tRNA synthetase
MTNKGDQMTLSDELTWRGFINQTTFTDIAQINEPRTFYFGVDPSADSMQIGNLAAAMMVRHFMDHGHKAVLLVGGATGMIGDPDGKKQERDLKTPEEIARNKAAIIRQYETIFAGKEFEVVDNYEWFSRINYLQFLRDIGKHVSMTQLLDRDFIQSRIGEGGAGISYAEFSYSLIQGYDFLHLYRTKGVTLQLAGADQWGNTITGVSLLRKLEGVEAHVFTTPLIVNKQTGIKFGKSEGGAVWLDGEKTSPYKFYQFWLNINDEMARDLVKIYTLLPHENIESLIREHDENPGQRLLQRTIAHEVTQLVHGEARSAAVERATELLFGSGVTEVDDAVADELAGEIPIASVGQSVVETLVQAGICSGKGEARRLLTAGAISMNGSKLQDDQVIDQPALVKKGKNTFLLVR